MSPAEPDTRVPAYLGRVLNAGGEPVGTCFQVAAGVLATAWHVLDDIGAGEIEAVVAVDPLAGGEAREATVVAIDPLADLAVLRVASPLGASIAGLRATDDVPLGLAVDRDGLRRDRGPRPRVQPLRRARASGPAARRATARCRSDGMTCDLVARA